jgi:hypothetical protein
LADVLDIVDLSFIQPMPLHHQVENHVIDKAKTWKKVNRITWTEVSSIIEPLRGPLWRNGTSSFHGINDQVPEAQIDQYNSSLILIRLENLELRVLDETRYNRPNEREVRATFAIGGYTYRLVVTDPTAKTEFLAKPDGAYPIKNAVIGVSLAEPYHGFAYKLVATIFTPDRQ